jgi:hypothetical protein
MTRKSAREPECERRKGGMCATRGRAASVTARLPKSAQTVVIRLIVGAVALLQALRPRLSSRAMTEQSSKPRTTK